MLELALLGLLQEKEASYGYELKKELDRRLGHFWQVSMGSLYPTLDRLATRGAVDVLDTEDRSSRRSRKVFRITDAGRALFEELIEDRAATQWEEDKFPLRLAFFHFVKPEIRIRLLERRREYLEDKLDDLRTSLGDAQGRIDSYTLSLMQHGLETTQADIVWLDDLIAAERRQLEEPANQARATTRTTPDPEPPPPTVERAPARSRG